MTETPYTPDTLRAAFSDWHTIEVDRPVFLFGFRTLVGQDAWASYDGIRMPEIDRRKDGNTEVHTFMLTNPPSGHRSFQWGHGPIVPPEPPADSASHPVGEEGT